MNMLFPKSKEERESLECLPCKEEIRLFAWQTWFILMSKTAGDYKPELSFNVNILLTSLRPKCYLIVIGLLVSLSEAWSSDAP